MNPSAYIEGYLRKDPEPIVPKKKKVKSREADLNSFVNKKLKKRLAP
jgi:hypothetical protein